MLISLSLTLLHICCDPALCSLVLYLLLLFSYSVMSDFLWPMDCSTAGFSVLHGLLECSNSCPVSWWCCPSISSSIILFSSCLQSFQESGSFPMMWLCIRWPNYWSLSFNFSISPSNEYSGLISFRMDWLDLLAVKSLLQHHSWKPSILGHSAFFLMQFSHPHMTTGKIIALTRWTSGSKVMSLLFNMLSRFLIVFLPRSKCLLISWLQSPSAVILGPRK